MPRAPAADQRDQPSSGVGSRIPQTQKSRNPTGELCAGRQGCPIETAGGDGARRVFRSICRQNPLCRIDFRRQKEKNRGSGPAGPSSGMRARIRVLPRNGPSAQRRWSVSDCPTPVGHMSGSPIPVGKGQNRRLWSTKLRPPRRGRVIWSCIGDAVRILKSL